MIYTSSYDELVIHLSLTHSLWTAWSCSMWVIEWVNFWVLFVFLTDWLIASCLHDCSLVSVDCKVVNTKNFEHTAVIIIMHIQIHSIAIRFSSFFSSFSCMNSLSTAFLRRSSSSRAASSALARIAWVSQQLPGDLCACPTSICRSC